MAQGGVRPKSARGQAQFTTLTREKRRCGIPQDFAMRQSSVAFTAGLHAADQSAHALSSTNSTRTEGARAEGSKLLGSICGGPGGAHDLPSTAVDVRPVRCRED